MRPISTGSAGTPGVTLRDGGIDVAVQSTSAEAIAICLFDADDREIDRLRLPGRTGDMFHGHVAGVAAGTRYGLRAYGAWDPANGHRFNPSKLLVDPFATAIDRPFRLHPLLFDHAAPLPDDTAPLMPKAIVGTPALVSPADRPAFDWSRQIIYELHVRGFTMTHPDIPPEIRGTFAGLGHPASIRHLTRLGVTTVELMPSAAWIDERHLPPLNRTDYWGYNPVAFLAPDPRLAPGGWPEVRAAVEALHAAGLHVILDVVLNHSGESDEQGPTLSLRGLDNAGYYRLDQRNPALYVNDAGCGNVLAMDRPLGLRLGLDALRAWARFGGLDGFRLDLAATLARRDSGFDPHASFLLATEQDPELAGRVMIAEPWDIGSGGYQLGAFPARWGEWNDRFRDTVRRFWRGDGGMAGGFATRFAGSADIFAGHRPIDRSVNYITAHDGFTLADLVSYRSKRNEANGEHNRDGSDDNLSWNNGVEGPTDDPAIQAGRQRDVRALLATLLLSRGTPMLSMGDEAGRSQAGNNNAYAQDNATSWFDWAGADQALIDFTADVIAVRQRLAPLFNGKPLQGSPALDTTMPDATMPDATMPDVVWLRPDGQPPSADDWNHDTNRTVIAALSGNDRRAVLVFHAGADPVEIVLPAHRPAYRWRRLLDSTEPAHDTAIPPRAVTVFIEAAAPGGSRVLSEATAPVGGRLGGVPDAALDHLARLAGIDPVWWDVEGGFHPVSADTKQALLAAMRLPAATLDDCRDSLARLKLERSARFPPMRTVRDNQPIRLDPAPGQPKPAWLTLLREDGSLHRFHTADGAALLPPQPLGRHRLMREDQPDRICHLTVAPPACYLPPNLAAPGLAAPGLAAPGLTAPGLTARELVAPASAADKRRFGIAAHLYTLRHSGDQGIGDFTTLARFAAQAARSGAAVLGLNPLHALFPHDRSRTSPYQPSDRRFLDPIYIDVADLSNHGQHSGTPAEAAAIETWPGAVDYAAVWNRKRAILWTAFIAEPPDPAAPVPEALLRLATFETIAGVLQTSDWQSWPAELRHPASAGVPTFVAEHRDLVAFHVFLQTLADRQFAAAARAAKDSGLSFGFYRDLAVGAAPDGAEAWSNQDTLMLGVSVGAPPDPFAAAGQIWSLPPLDPLAMRRDGYAAFAELLEANMRHAGALRIDHVMGLQRLFVVPDGATGAAGAYVNYPRDDLLAQVALQSHRARCLVVGEDLGTVPEGMSNLLAANQVLSYSVLWFERAGDTFKSADAWRRLTAACVSTHDLPTLAGWWNGADIEERHGLGLIDDQQAVHANNERAQEKIMLIDRLQQQRLLTQPVDLAQPLPIPVAAAVHAFICSTPALLALVQADDLAGETVPVNLPGTDRERPNWRRRVDIDVSALCRTPLAQAILAALQPRATTDWPIDPPAGGALGLDDDQIGRC